jgi:hypothetical protein
MGIANGSNSQALLAASTAATCNNSFDAWWVGSRTQWNVTADTYLGIDVLYQKLDSANSGGVFTPTSVYPTTLAGVAIKQASSMDNWSARFRAHKDFYP